MQKDMECIAKDINAYRTLLGNLAGKIPLG
jgi:hypothetical protein